MSIGIDFGTTFSTVVLIYNLEDGAMVLPDSSNNNEIPSIAYLEKQEKLMTLVAGAAAERYQGDKNLIIHNKRFCGRKFLDVDMQINTQKYSYGIQQNNDGGCKYMIKTADKIIEITPNDVAYVQLSGLLKIVKRALNDGPLLNLAISVPAHADLGQKTVTLEIAKRALKAVGIDYNKPVELLQEPICGVVGHIMINKHELENKCDEEIKENCYIVFDVGGGTTDISIIRATAADNDHSVVWNITAVGSTGLRQKGGVDIDHEIKKILLNKMEHKGIEINDDVLEQLERGVEKLKIHLSSSEEAVLKIYTARGAQLLKITRAELKDFYDRFVKDVIKPWKLLVDKLERYGEDIEPDFLLTIGGTCMVPAIREGIASHFKDQATVIKVAECRQLVAKGAAYIAHVHQERDLKISITETSSFEIGVKVDRDEFLPMIKVNDTLPVSRTEHFRNPAPTRVLAICIFEGTESKCSKNQEIGEFKLKFDEEKPANEIKLAIKITLGPNAELEVIGWDRDDLDHKGIFTGNMVEIMRDHIKINRALIAPESVNNKRYENKANNDNKTSFVGKQEVIDDDEAINENTKKSDKKRKQSDKGNSVKEESSEPRKKKQKLNNHNE